MIFWTSSSSSSLSLILSLSLIASAKGEGGLQVSSLGSLEWTSRAISGLEIPREMSEICERTIEAMASDKAFMDGLKTANSALGQRVDNESIVFSHVDYDAFKIACSMFMGSVCIRDSLTGGFVIKPFAFYCMPKMCNGRDHRLVNALVDEQCSRVIRRNCTLSSCGQGVQHAPTVWLILLLLSFLAICLVCCISLAVKHFCCSRN